MKILFIGDVVGEPGRKTLRRHLDTLVQERGVQLVVANVENAAGGFGITPPVVEELLGMGIHVLTSGNHIWDKKDILGYIEKEDRLLRPANYPPGVPGTGSLVFPIPGGPPVGILNLMGRVFMGNWDCPFQVFQREIPRLREATPIILVDFHAEATSEKQAFAWYVDGQVSAVLGTHTHVQTADEQILPGGTAYITDVGLTGPRQGVIGMAQKGILERFLTQMPRRFEVARGPTVLSAVVVEVDPQSGRARGIERIQIHET